MMETIAVTCFKTGSQVQLRIKINEEQKNQVNLLFII